MKIKTKMGAAQKFQNVSMKVIYLTQEQMITDTIVIEYIIISKEKYDFGNFIPAGKGTEVAKEILQRVFKEYIE